MSNIPFYFDVTPQFFRKNGLFKDPKTRVFVTWAFERCSPQERTIEHNKVKITLKPYQFIFGRTKCSEESGLTEKQIRIQIDELIKRGILKNETKRTTKRFTVYEWSTEVFSNIQGQEKGQEKQLNNKTQSPSPCNKLTGAKRKAKRIHREVRFFAQEDKNIKGQENGHNQEEQEKKYKESHHPYPSSFSTNEKGLTDLSFKTQESKPTDLTFEANGTDGVQNPQHSDNQPPFLKHNLYYQDHQTKQTANNLKDRELSDTKNNLNSNYPPSSSKNEVYPGVFLTQVELDECIAIKGSSEKVKQAVEYIMRSRGRKCKIYNWPNAMRTWDIKCDIKPRIEENREMGKRLQDLYQSPLSWSCEVYRDQKKDQDGVLFANRSPAGRGDSIFIAFIDPEFKEKATKIIREKKMQKALIPNS